MEKLFVNGALMASHKDKGSPCPAYIENHQVSFKVKGFAPFEPSFATIEKSANAKAYGIIIELPQAKLEKYIEHEVGYAKKKMKAIDNNNKTHECITLVLA